MRPLNDRSFWLLEQLVERARRGIDVYGQPLGISPVTFTTWTAPLGVSMHTLAGLVRRGYAEERRGLYYATTPGTEAYHAEKERRHGQA